MAIVNINVECCHFCIEFHQQYMRGIQPDYIRKRAVVECWLCEQSMCADCQASSQKELQGDALAIYGLTICQRCTTEVRRLTTRHKDYEEIVSKALEKFK